LINKLKPKSDFSKNVLTLMTGTTIAQAIPIAISPILTRIYTPEDFGIFALYVAMTSIFGSIANGRYEVAIMLPRKDEDAINILALGLIINIILSIFLFLAVFLFNDYIVELLNNKDISKWLYLIPFSVFLMGCFNLLSYFNNRKKLYKDLAQANIYKSIGMAVVQLCLGILKVGVFGLISGQFISQIISNTKLFFNIKKLDLFVSIRSKKIIILAKKYKNFFKFDVISTIFNTISNIGMPLVITIFFNVTTVGYYFFANKMVRLPLSFILGSLSQVYYQEASSLYRKDTKQLLSFTLNIQKKILIFILPTLVVVSIIGPFLFEFIFGSKWIVAGEYIKYFAIYVLFNSLYSPISTLGDILMKQKLVLYFNISLVLNIIFCMYIGNNIFDSFKYTLLLVSINGALHFILLNIYMLNYLKGYLK